MSTQVASERTQSPAHLVDAESTYCKGWWIHALDRVDSTSTIAATLPAWQAVRANTQSAGRGRTGRQWISDQGGLWLSAVLPCEIDQPGWQYLPLAVGWSLANALSELGVRGLRLRWPNDLMVGRRKLAGVLVERFNRHTAVVGVGINVSNTPEVLDPRLFGTTTRLEELIPEVGSWDELTVFFLSSLRRAHEQLEREGFSAIAHELNTRWTEPRQVELTFSSGTSAVRGRFAGIDPRGALRLATDHGPEIYDATQVALLRELD